MVLLHQFTCRGYRSRSSFFLLREPGKKGEQVIFQGENSTNRSSRCSFSHLRDCVPPAGVAGKYFTSLSQACADIVFSGEVRSTRGTIRKYGAASWVSAS